MMSLHAGYEDAFDSETQSVGFGLNINPHVKLFLSINLFLVSNFYALNFPVLQLKL